MALGTHPVAAPAAAAAPAAPAAAPVGAPRTRPIHPLDVLAGANMLVYCVLGILLIGFGETFFLPKLPTYSDRFGHYSQACNLVNVFLAMYLSPTFVQTKPNAFETISSLMTIFVALALGAVHWAQTHIGAPMNYHIDQMWWNMVQVGLIEVVIYIWNSFRVAKLHP